MDGDLVNSIYDTEESEQVAGIVISTYRAMVSNTKWPSHRRLTDLDPYSDSTKPTHMTLDDNVKELISVNYNTAKSGDTRKLYTEMKYCSPDDFLRKTNMRNTDSSNTVVITDPSGVDIIILNDTAPSYFTSFDDSTIVFDSYDSTVDSTLQSSKFQVTAYIMTELSMNDTSVPDLPPDAFTALIEEATSRCQSKIRQFNDVKSEQESQRQSRWLSRKAFRTNGGIKYPNYGRR